MEILSVVIPVYNAEMTIGHLCNTLISLYGQKYHLEIILVNDGSSDSSDVICRQLHEGHPDTITYVKLSRNFGEHSAVLAGLHHARGACCVIMDDDFQNPPGELEKLVARLKQGFDVVYAAYPAKRDNWFRNIGSKLNDWTATLLLDKPRGLYLSSFKALNGFVVKEIVKYRGSAPYLDAIILRTTDNIGSVEIEHHARKEGQSGYTLSKLISLWGSSIVSFSLLPLRIIGVTGLLFIMGGVVYGIYKAVDGIGKSSSLTDYETLMTANMIFRGMVLLAVSIIGEYVGRIHRSMSNDPQFIIRDRLSAVRKSTGITYIGRARQDDGIHEPAE